ncbi:hypothetical protein [Photorhabdus thracensis]|uniref:hypothetical protein n=1 Tax=Photorhabdus thracensis TaxID=230089 RepID=UPI001E5C0772|nr:hypothetical protein [Photorhabdus thracensis]MCC8421955.1 hypothetical protein [Photorhabdus thracensis]
MMNHDEINLLRKKLTITENKLAEYELLIRAFCDDDENWHKLADSKNELISVLFHKLLSVAEELKSDETRYLALLFYPRK